MRLLSHTIAALLAYLHCCHSAVGDILPSACLPEENKPLVSHVPACKNFVSLLEDQSYCSLEQLQNCCSVLSAATAARCHCLQELTTSTAALFEILQQHCSSNNSTNTLSSKTTDSNLNLKVYFGVLTSSANFQQRQAGRPAIC